MALGMWCVANKPFCKQFVPIQQQNKFADRNLKWPIPLCHNTDSNTNIALGISSRTNKATVEKHSFNRPRSPFDDID